MMKAEKRALRVAGQELAGLAEDLPNPAWIAYADGYIFWFNRAWYDYTGTTPEEVEGWGWTSVHHPDELARATDIWTRAIATGEPAELTISLRGRDGSHRPFLTRAAPIRDSTGTIVRWFGTNSDISAQVAAEERARLAEEDWRNLFDEMQEGFTVLQLVTDSDGAASDAVIVNTNKQFERLTGLPFASAVGLSVREVTGNAAPVLIETFARVAGTGQSETFEIDVEPLGRSYEIRAYRHAVQQVAAVYLDISARRAAEAEARRAQDSLIRVSRLNAMGAMASTLAHELNQPLGAAANYIAAANEHLKRSPDPETQELQQLLANANENCLKAGQIIHSMRDFTATGKVAKTPEDLKQIIAATIADFLDGEAPEGLEFAFTCPNDLPLLMCDRIQIGQVLVNLYSNSVRAMASVEARLIRIDVTARPDVVLIRLGDSGPGFIGRSPEELFEPFWSTTDVGLGLGLPLCRTIIEAHGGAIWGELGNVDGACFFIRLPVSAEEA
jgi:PAS domain S-box-containing protein